jgi:hypothetical protein
MKTQKSYETKFADGSEINPYSACGCFEGFEPREDVLDNIRAASYIAGIGLWKNLQGHYGRTINSMVENGILTWNGIVNWERVEEILENA